MFEAFVITCIIVCEKFLDSDDSGPEITEPECETVEEDVCTAHDEDISRQSCVTVRREMCTNGRVGRKLEAIRVNTRQARDAIKCRQVIKVDFS